MVEVDLKREGNLTSSSNVSTFSSGDLLRKFGYSSESFVRSFPKLSTQILASNDKQEKARGSRG